MTGPGLRQEGIQADCILRTGPAPRSLSGMKTQTDSLVRDLARIVGPANVATGEDATRWSSDWAGTTSWTPLAVARPASTAEVSEVVKLAAARNVPVVPVSGNTGLTRATEAGGALMISLDRMSGIREIRPEARVAVVEAGVVLARLHEAVEEHELIFPLSFGARGSAMIGGALSTNAGGSNVVRYGSTRGLCLGLEVVLADGRVLDLMSALHKDNSGYDLRDLFIGAEGTLGIITGAVLRLFPKPRAYVTAMVACPSISGALRLLNTLQAETGGAVEAFEYMPGAYIDAHLERVANARPPFDARHDVNIMVEVGALSARDAHPGPDGSIPIATQLEDSLERLLESGEVLDAVVAQTQAQRAEMWARREAAADVCLLRTPLVHNDIAVPVDKVDALIERTTRRATALDPGIRFLSVAHLGDGNLHFAAWPDTHDPGIHAAIHALVEEETAALGGSFSAEHGIGLSKLDPMARHKSPVALDVMRTIKAALDPQNIMNPGKVLPPR